MRTWRIGLGLLPLSVILVYQVKAQNGVEEADSPRFVPFGEYFWLNCSTPVPEDITFESRLKKGDTKTGANWAAVNVFVDDWEDSKLYCLYEDIRKFTIVMAYALPSDVTIDLQTELEEGKEYTIKCTVHDVAPLEYLTIFIRRGGYIINSKSYEGPHVMNPQTVSHLYTFNASRSDHLKNFSCEAVLQLGSDRHTVNSSEITVHTYTLPDAPVIKVQKWIEHGTVFTAECLVANAFPPKDVSLKMFIDDTPLDGIGEVTNGGSVKGTAELNATYSLLGFHTIRCEAHLFTLSMDSREHITIYELPTMHFSLSSNTTSLKENVTATCDITNKNPEGYGLSISVDGKEGQRKNSTTLTHTFTTSRRTPILDVTCMAYIIENTSISQSSRETLEVHYPPEFTEYLCPSTVLLVEGERFLCKPYGNPIPTVECHVDGDYINVTVIATRNMTGNYTCRATNKEGEAMRHVDVTVQYPPMNPTLTISPNSTIKTGNPLNITCTSDGLPAPTYRWTIPDNADVTYSKDMSSIIIHTTTSTHSGSYTCEANNKHGRVSTGQEVTVIADSVHIGWIIGIVAAIACVAAFVGVLVHHLWKKGRKGFYELIGKKTKAKSPDPIRTSNLNMENISEIHTQPKK